MVTCFPAFFHISSPLTNRETITALHSFVSELAKPEPERVPSPSPVPAPPKPRVEQPQDSPLWGQPDYLLYDIFLYFRDEIQDSRSIRLTCRKFARLCSIDHVLSFDISKNREQTETGNFHFWKVLNFAGFSRIVLDKATPRLKILERFSVWHCHSLTQEARLLIAKLPETAPNLKYLAIHNVLL
jgi:hypothetical protein